MIVFVQPEAVALSVHLSQAAFVAFVADLEVNISTSEAVPVALLVHHL